MGSRLGILTARAVAVVAALGAAACGGSGEPAKTATFDATPVLTSNRVLLTPRPAILRTGDTVTLSFTLNGQPHTCLASREVHVEHLEQGAWKDEWFVPDGKEGLRRAKDGDAHDTTPSIGESTTYPMPRLPAARYRLLVGGLNCHDDTDHEDETAHVPFRVS
jgi:hypothetical protein